MSETLIRQARTAAKQDHRSPFTAPLLDDLADAIEDAQAALAAVEQQNDRYREALHQIATQERYTLVGAGVTQHETPYERPESIARKALTV